MELLGSQVSCMRMRFGRKGHKGFQPERKWEIPRIKFDGKIMSSIMDVVLRYLYGGIQKVI